jgi:hypothetical protein
VPVKVREWISPALASPAYDAGSGGCGSGLPGCCLPGLLGCRVVRNRCGAGLPGRRQEGRGTRHGEAEAAAADRSGACKAVAPAHVAVSGVTPAAPAATPHQIPRIGLRRHQGKIPTPWPQISVINIVPPIDANDASQSLANPLETACHGAG